jgi:phospholipid/cholesterol/gamma-HCH transport system substrate-binding protein
LGLGLFGSFALWLRGFSFGKQHYTVVISFRDIAKMQLGAPVRYRGVQVGAVSEINARSNHVDVAIQITPATLRIPRQVRIEANQAGFIGETSIDIFPFQDISIAARNTNPLDKNCKSELIICDRDRLQGEIGVTFDELLRSSLGLSKLFSNPQFFGNLSQLIQNTTVVTAEVTALSRDLQQLTQLTEKELGRVSTTAVQSANTISQAVTQISGTVNELGTTAKQVTASIDRFGSTANQIGNTIDQFGTTANQIGNTANQIGNTIDQFGTTANQIGNTVGQLQTTANELNSLVRNVNGLVVANRSTLVQTLDNLSQTSEDLRVAVNRLDPAIAQVETGLNQAQIPQLLTNLQQVSANAVQVSTDAAQATANLRDLSNPTNLILLQQTLDSARATFENAEKITSDLDRLTGDPTFFNDLRQLIDSLNNLLSVTEQLEQQAAIAQNLDPIVKIVNDPATSLPQVTPSNSKSFLAPASQEAP